jgi:hypothetical protein
MKKAAPGWAALMRGSVRGISAARAIPPSRPSCSP